MRAIPKTEEVISAIKNVFKEERVVNSQKKLKELVDKELAKINPLYKVSQKRVRVLALTSSFVSPEIHAREGEERKSALAKCPSCGSKLRVLKNRTIFDGTVVLGFICKKCSYWTGKKRRIPTRYIFHLK